MISDDDQNDMMSDDFADDGFGDDLFDDEIQFEDFDTGGASGQSFSELWKNNPLVKVGVVGAGLIVLIGIFTLFGGEQETTDTSVIRAGRDITDTPGSTEVSPEFEKAVEEVNQRRVEEALRNQGSAMPTPIGPGDDRLTLPQEQAQEEDPLERWKRIKEERAAREAQTEQDALPETDPNAPAIEALSSAMVTQMENILESLVPLEPNSEVIATTEYLEKLREDEEQEREEARAEEEANQTDSIEIVNIIIPAGEIEYGQLITRANSDTDGPVLLELASGPLAGARMLGEFEERFDYLVISFDRVIVDGIAYSTEAIAIDPATADVGMVTEYNGRYFMRIVLPTAAAFVEGLGAAIAESGSSSTTIDGGAGTSTTTEEDLDIEQEIFAGIENASSEAGDIIDEIASEVEPQIIVEAGTPMGILFLEPVTDE